MKGKESFETRGCMGCHSVGEGSNPVGGTFAANLSRVGEKDNYDYLVRWIHNPARAHAPYCPFEKRDLTEEDYKKHGLPFVFDLDHSQVPERRPRTAGGADDHHAQPAPLLGGSARYRQLPDDAQGEGPSTYPPAPIT